MSAVTFKSKLETIGDILIIRLPESASKKLPSRGQVMVEATINGYHFQTPLEPDGKGSHWFATDEHLRKAVALKSGDTVSLAVEVSKSWPEPDVPADLMHALTADPEALSLWKDITNGAMGMDPMDPGYKQYRNPQKTYCSRHLQIEIRRTTAVLLEPQPVY